MVIVMDTKLLFFSAEARHPAGKYLMNLIYPIEVEFNKRFLNKYSGDKLYSITIIFICTDEEMLSLGFYQERRYISWKNKYADIRLIIPYSKFINADNGTRKKMMWDVIERSLDYIRKRKAFINIDELERDLHTVYWSV